MGRISAVVLCLLIVSGGCLVAQEQVSKPLSREVSEEEWVVFVEQATPREIIASLELSGDGTESAVAVDALAGSSMRKGYASAAARLRAGAEDRSLSAADRNWHLAGTRWLDALALAALAADATPREIIAALESVHTKQADLLRALQDAERVRFPAGPQIPDPLSSLTPRQRIAYLEATSASANTAEPDQPSSSDTP